VEIERDFFNQLLSEHDVIISKYALLQFNALRALQILEEKELEKEGVLPVSQDG